MDDLLAIVGLNMIKGVGPQKIHFLIRHFSSAEKVLSASFSSLSEVVGEGVASLIVSQREGIEPEREIDRAEEVGARIITIEDDEYPENLRLTSDPPILLYIKGRVVSEDRISIGIVGSRKASAYGRKIAEELSIQLAEAGFTIISGLARGIDTIAHKTAILCKKRTIGVLGCGINIVYPLENEKLFCKVAEAGAVVSEFPLDTPPEKLNFPQRNRIISGLSLGTVVIEAGERSGALITARIAIEAGREVFAVPGPVTSPQSKGTNRLIKEGAKLVESAEDIVEELGPLIERILEE